MDTNPVLLPSIPASTIRAARSLYGQGNIYLRLGDRVNSLASRLDPSVILKNPEEDRFVLPALLTIIQYIEKLTDVELAESIQRRMDLRYALHLDTPSPRLNPESLCVFRNRILTDTQVHGWFEEMFNLVYPELASSAMSERVEIDDVVWSICKNEVRASLMGAMLRSIEALSATHFNWLRQIALPHWYERYNRAVHSASLHTFGRRQEPTQEDIQADIQHLLNEIRASNLCDIMEMPEAQNLILIGQQLKGSESMKNCNQCIHKIH